MREPYFVLARAATRFLVEARDRWQVGKVYER
jgi:hypothetical protein